MLYVTDYFTPHPFNPLNIHTNEKKTTLLLNECEFGEYIDNILMVHRYDNYIDHLEQRYLYHQRKTRFRFYGGEHGS